MELRITSGNCHCDNKSLCIRSKNKSRVVTSFLLFVKYRFSRDFNNGKLCSIKIRN